MIYFPNKYLGIMGDNPFNIPSSREAALTLSLTLRVVWKTKLCDTNPFLLTTNLCSRHALWQKYCRQITPKELYKPCRSWIENENRKNFIYERQTHIRFVSTLAQRAAHSSSEKSFSFNYIWTFLWAKQRNGIRWDNHKMHNRPLTRGKFLSLASEDCSVGAGKSNLIAIINEVIKIFAKVWNMSGTRAQLRTINCVS